MRLMTGSRTHLLARLAHYVQTSRCASAWSAPLAPASTPFGQPVPATHPHLLKAGELTIGITATEYQRRRSDLAQSLPPGGIAVLEAAPLRYRSGAVFYPYRQESNFLYLTGFLEQDAVAAIQRTGKQPGDYCFHLFVKPAGGAYEQWTGPRSGLDAAVQIWNADVAHEVGSASVGLAELCASASYIYTDVPAAADLSVAPSRDYGVCAAVLSDMNTEEELKLRPLTPLVNELRVVKSTAEIANMRRAGQLSGRVLTEAMRRHWETERDLHAFLDHGFSTSGCDGPAYIPVVAGGDNGRVIHYVRNNCILCPQDLVLVDAGGEYGTYVADITRTWPVSGTFSPAQRDLYQAVLNVQRHCISLCQASLGISLNDIDRAARVRLADELAALGFSLPNDRIRVLFPHHVSHHVGLDIHDVQGFDLTRPLLPGYCVTMEPGVYVPHDDRWPSHFRGMAVRIEDSVCVQQDSHVILTTEAVKEVVDIEYLRRSI